MSRIKVLGVRWAIVAILVPVVVGIPGASDAGLPGVGIFEAMAEAGRYHPGCGLWAFEQIHFAGRMPAGAKTYTVTNGTGGGSDCIPAHASEISLHGETPSGSFDWSCYSPRENSADPGGIWSESYEEGELYRGLVVFDGTCTTLGRPGSFRLHLRLVVFGDDQHPDPYTWGYQARGVYWTTSKLTL